jgi:hypothetical protein
VRKHLSAIKGGRLAAAAYPARLLTLVISGAPEDNPAVIASGPTVADTSTFAEARVVTEKYRVTEPRSVVEHLMCAADETPKQGAPRLANTSTAIIATLQRDAKWLVLQDDRRATIGRLVSRRHYGTESNLRLKCCETAVPLIISLPSILPLPSTVIDEPVTVTLPLAVPSRRTRVPWPRSTMSPITVPVGPMVIVLWVPFSSTATTFSV